MNISRMAIGIIVVCACANGLVRAQTGEAGKGKADGAFAAPQGDLAALKNLKTVAERSEFKETARFEDVGTFLKELAADSMLVRSAEREMNFSRSANDATRCST